MELTTKDLVIGKCYRIKSHNALNMKPDRVRDINFLASAPFVIVNHDEDNFHISGLLSYAFEYSTLTNAESVFEEATPLKWEADKIYTVNSLYVNLFRGCFGAVAIRKQDDLLRYLGERFTVEAVSNGGSVLSIHETDKIPPNGARYVLEPNDRRFFTEIGLRVEVAAEPKPEPLETKLRAFFVLQQGNRINISNERDGSNERLDSYDAFVSWLNKTLENGVIDLKSVRRRYEENLDTVNKISETVSAALEG